MKRLKWCCVVAVLGVLLMPVRGQEEPPKRVESPNRRAVVEMLEEPMPGADIMDFFTLRLTVDGKTLGDFPTYGYLLDVFWSRSGKYVAINNRRGNSGDYLWVISLENGLVVKRPDDDQLMQRGGKLVKEFYQGGAGVEWNKEWLVAKGWAEDQLQVRYLMTTRRDVALQCFFRVLPQDQTLVVQDEKVSVVPEEK